MSEEQEETRDPLLAALRALASADVLYNAAVADRLGITVTDLRCLSYLDEVGAASPGQLGAWSGLTSGAITGVVNRLVAAGLAQRESEPGDARRVRVTPTADRAAEVEALMRPLGARLVEAAAPLTAGERRAVTAFVERARAVLAAEAQRLRHSE